MTETSKPSAPIACPVCGRRAKLNDLLGAYICEKCEVEIETDTDDMGD